MSSPSTVPESEPAVSGEAGLVGRIRLLSVLPLLLAGLAILLIPALRAEMVAGLTLLGKGDFGELRDWAAGLGPWALVVTGMLMVAQAIVAPLPALLVTAANSFLLGPFWGGLYSIATANLAASICYGIGRGFGAGVVSRLVGQRNMDRTDDWLKRHGTITVLAARLIPVVPFDPISYFAGMVRMPFWPFFLATLVGQIPAGMAWSYLAQSVAEPRPGTITLMGSALAVAAIAGYWLMKYNRGTN